ncbi:hypothetical protein HK097_005834 [Rhizophlyctis rosea]|uniref:Coiled-coil domain-containing protein 112 n=1 Tax=Rhizophlyctis rosea TaxID=64517 RepID=A0AAD5SF88_9FUNG|nr:hypothetical protein HK097_005834 [Rhizophlyctis rosea]
MMMNKVHLQDAFTQAEEEKMVYAQQRRREMQLLNGRIKAIRASVDQLMQHVQHPQSGHTYIDTLKRLMETIESDMIVFKQSQRDQYDQLLQEEKKLMQEIATMEEHVAGWEHQSAHENNLYEPVSDQPTAIKKRGSVDPQSQLLPEVVAFQDYLARHGGHSGGWDDLMHNSFVKLRQKHKANSATFFSNIVSAISGVTLEEATAHERWYRGYCKLRDARKAAIERWKKRKAALLAKQAELLERKAEKTEKGQEVNKEEETRLREEKKKEIERWKDAQKQKAEKAQRTAQEEAQRQKEAQKRWKQDHEKVKHKVTEYVQRRSHEQALLKQVEQEAKRIREAARCEVGEEDLKRLAQRNEELSMKKRQLMEAKAQEEEMKQRRIEKLRASVESMITVDRDPDRVLRPTEAMKKKVQAPKDVAEIVKGKFRPPMIPKRHVPNWRQGV